MADPNESENGATTGPIQGRRIKELRDELNPILLSLQPDNRNTTSQLEEIKTMIRGLSSQTPSPPPRPILSSTPTYAQPQGGFSDTTQKQPIAKTESGIPGNPRADISNGGFNQVKAQIESRDRYTSSDVNWSFVSMAM